MPRLQTTLGLVAAAALLIASAPPLVHAGNPAAPASADGIPRGQMVRRALSGTVAGVGSGSINVQTNFGIVIVGIGGAVVRAPGQEDFTAADIQIGDRVAVLLDRSPVDPDSLPSDDDQEPTATPTDGTSATSTPPAGGTDGTVSATSTPPVINETPAAPSATSTPPAEPTATPAAGSRTPRPLPAVVIRSVNALRVTVVPANPLRTHLRGVVGEKGNGRVRLLKGSGEEEDIAWEGEGPEVGSDVIVVAQRGPRDGPRRVSAASTPDAVSERLERLQEKLVDKQAALAEKIAEMNQVRNEKRIERLEATRGNAPAHVQDKIDQHISSARGGRGGAGQTSDASDASDQGQDGSAGDSDQSARPGNSNPDRVSGRGSDK